jgi:hypothetical protein
MQAAALLAAENPMQETIFSEAVPMRVANSQVQALAQILGWPALEQWAARLRPGEMS